MKLYPPFAFSARLMPALKIGKAWLSYDYMDSTVFWLDLSEVEHKIEGFDPPQMLVQGALYPVQDAFNALFSFLFAAVESRQYREREGKPHDPEDRDTNENLFTKEMVDWADENADQIQLLQIELEEQGLVAA